MNQPLSNIRGTYDLGPADTLLWQQLEMQLISHAQHFGYQEVRFPCLEKSELFRRTSGETSDIVSKEMYGFIDQNGDHLSLRPEGTAGCVRAAIQQGWLHNQTPKLYYIGPMFRRERPQKGRFRQFNQFGLEAFGLSGPSIDFELLVWTQACWQKLGLHSLTLQINSLGDQTSRSHYSQVLTDYFMAHSDTLSPSHHERLDKNPLRLLDSKDAELQQLIQDAPSLHDSLTTEQKDQFSQLCDLLDEAQISYHINEKLVRGLDYYNDCVFEWVSDELGAQGTVCAGGRYDQLVSQLGGKPTPGVGLAIGLERLMLLYQAAHQPPLAPGEIWITGDSLPSLWATYHRLAATNLSTPIRIDHQQRSVKSLQKKAKKLGIDVILHCHQANHYSIHPQIPPFNELTVDDTQLIHWANQQEKPNV